MRAVQAAAEYVVMCEAKPHVLAGLAMFLELVRRGLAQSDGRTVTIVATPEEVQTMLLAVEDRVASLTPPPPPCVPAPQPVLVALRSAA